ncbi:MAG: nuclear transport factor 2 family protein [Candidatus Sulfotelmatobacter sp.]
MRASFSFVCVVCLIQGALTQQSTPAPVQSESAPTSFAEDLKSPAVSAESKLKHMFEEKIGAEWAAIKKQDRKAYGDLLADDYEGVEVDGKGERTKSQAVNELADSNIANYTLWGFKLIPLCPDANLAIYEVTMQFPPKSQVRFSRVYITELWMKRADDWKIVHYQETHVK